MRESISVCLIVKNEAQLLANCLRSVAPIAHEIVLVDTGSTDATMAIARKFGARVLTHQWTGDYAAARNVYVRAATGRWILVIDGDESIAAADLPRIERLVGRGSAAGYRVLIRNYTDDFDLLWRWSPNDGTYRREERLSRCEGWMATRALRLFRNAPGVTYGSGSSTHCSTEGSVAAIGTIKDTALTLHHFQCLKGGVRFIAGKQQRRLPNELRDLGRPGADLLPFLNAAKTLFSEGRDREAASIVTRLLRRDPRSHDAHHLAAMIAFERGRFRAAATHARGAIAADTRSADAWCLLGMICTEDGRAAEGASALKRALRLQPRHLMAHNSLGVAYADLGDARAARAQFRAALTLHRRFTPAALNLARLS